MARSKKMRFVPKTLFSKTKLTLNELATSSLYRVYEDMGAVSLVIAIWILNYDRNGSPEPQIHSKNLRGPKKSKKRK